MWLLNKLKQFFQFHLFPLDVIQPGNLRRAKNPSYWSPLPTRSGALMDVLSPFWVWLFLPSQPLPPPSHPTPPRLHRVSLRFLLSFVSVHCREQGLSTPSLPALFSVNVFGQGCPPTSLFDRGVGSCPHIKSRPELGAQVQLHSGVG